MEKQTDLFYDTNDINQRGLVVYETSNVPTSENPPQGDFLVIGLCIRGNALLSYNKQEIAISSHDIGFAMPDHTLTCLSPSPDYRVVFVFISKAFYHEMIRRTSFVDYRKYYYSPMCHLNDEQFENVMAILQVLQLVSEHHYPQRQESLTAILDVLFFELTRYRGEESEKTEADIRNEQLFNDFYNLLENNYKEHKDIIWYADQLFLSPKYFSFVIRQFTGLGAGEWIDDMIISQAKKLLHSQRDKNIEQIAQDLGFHESGSFCRFFKSRTGQRPSQYRKG